MCILHSLSTPILLPSHLPPALVCITSSRPRCTGPPLIRCSPHLPSPPLHPAQPSQSSHDCTSCFHLLLNGLRIYPYLSSLPCGSLRPCFYAHLPPARPGQWPVPGELLQVRQVISAAVLAVLPAAVMAQVMAGIIAANCKLHVFSPTNLPANFS